MSPFYEISSAPQVMKKGITLKIKPEPTKIDNKHFGIVKLNGDDGYSFAGGKFDSTDQIITQRIGSFGTYFIGADTVKPEVNIQFPSNGQTLAKMSQIKFRAKDALSGIGSDKNIRIAFDNRFVLPEWDPERDIISGMPHWEIEPGPHIIDIEVSDEAGNVNQQRLSIFIKAKN